MKKKAKTSSKKLSKKPAVSPRAAKKTTKASKDAAKTKKADTGERRAKGAKRPGGLDAAAKVMAEVGKPMSCKAIVERMLSQGLWQTKGKTPAATIYAAIIRHIAAKGQASRFRKVGRGQFTLNKEK